MGIVLAAATSWTGWAVSSLTSKFYKSGGGGRGRGGEAGTGGSSPAVSGRAVSSTSGGGVGTAAQDVGSGERREGEGEGDGKNEEEGWDEDEWEASVDAGLYYDISMKSLFMQDFNISGEQTPSSHEPGGMGTGVDKGGGEEEWEDDGWGTFEPLEDIQDMPSSGADFFDTLGQSSSKNTGPEEDLFERLGVGVSGGGGVKKPSPPPVSSSLFGDPSGGAGKRGGGEGDWGDWGSDFSSEKVLL